MADLFVDGNIAQTFGPQVAESYLCRLLQVYRRSFRATNDPRWPSAFFTTQPPLAHGRPFPDTYGRPIWLLDFAIRNRGTVVRQQIWAPQNEAQRHAHAPLNMPIFFVHNDQVTLGLPISIAATRDPMTLWSSQIMTKDQTPAHNTITSEKFAKRVASAVCRFIEVSSPTNFPFPAHRSLRPWCID